MKKHRRTLDQARKQGKGRRSVKRFSGVACLESLESREMLAGDVTVQLVRGDLYLHGDQHDNVVEIRSEGDQFLIEGLDGTTIHGRESVSVPQSHVSDDWRIWLGSGDDQLVLNDVRVPDDVYVSAGRGDDSVVVEAIQADTVVLYGGSGDDQLLVNSSEARHLSVRGDGGENTIGVADSTIWRDLSINGGGHAIVGLLEVTVEDDLRVGLGGESLLAIQGSEILDDTVVTGHGSSQILIQSSIHHDDVRIATSFRNDLLAIDDVKIGGDVHVNLGWGDDALAVSETTIEGRTNLDGGRGRDALQVADVVFGASPHVSRFEVEGVEGLSGRVDAALEQLAASGLVQPETAPSILEIVSSDANFSLLGTALGAAGLADVFAGEGDFTVFAPTNAAFEMLGDTLNGLLEDPGGALTEILTYHVLGERLGASDLKQRTSVTTLQGQQISIEVTESGLILDGKVRVEGTDIEASNGIVHVIETVLMPEAELPSIAEIAQTNDDFSRLLEAVSAAGLAGVLAGEGNFTVFAPTNAAFEKIPADQLAGLLADPTGALTQILTYHVLDESLNADELSAKESVVTLQGQEISVTVTDSGVLLNDTIRISATNIEASNGIVHVIDTVLIPELAPSIPEIVSSNPDLSRLNSLLERAGLTDVLAEGEYTLFAPTNSGLAVLAEPIVNLLFRFAPQFLTNVLLNHVAEGRFDAATLLAGETVTTLGGRQISLSTNADGTVGVGNALNTTVVEADIESSNGLVHVIDQVLL